MLQYFGQFLIAHSKIRVSGRLHNQAANRKSRFSDYDIKIVRTIDVIDRVVCRSQLMVISGGD
jgi:hypothetical protein